MEPELFWRCIFGLELPFEETEADRWARRFVGRSPTGVGVVGRERRAAAAAAFERLALEARLARKAWTAAVEAAAVGGVLAGWIRGWCQASKKANDRYDFKLHLLGLTMLVSGGTWFWQSSSKL